MEKFLRHVKRIRQGTEQSVSPATLRIKRGRGKKNIYTHCLCLHGVILQGCSRKQVGGRSKWEKEGHFPLDVFFIKAWEWITWFQRKPPWRPTAGCIYLGAFKQEGCNFKTRCKQRESVAKAFHLIGGLGAKRVAFYLQFTVCSEASPPRLLTSLL